MCESMRAIEMDVSRGTVLYPANQETWDNFRRLRTEKIPSWRKAVFRSTIRVHYCTLLLAGDVVVHFSPRLRNQSHILKQLFPAFVVTQSLGKTCLENTGTHLRKRPIS
jgi:hypothetical protein